MCSVENIIEPKMWKVFYYLTLLVLMFGESDCVYRNDIVSNEINNLSDLSLIELLKIQQNIDKLTCQSDTFRNSSLVEKHPENREFSVEMNIPNNHNQSVNNFNYNDDGKISALPLISENLNENQDIQRSFDYHHQHHHHPHLWEVEKPSKLQTVFQLSITALSFLAFGGYLLCMIVQAIKSKGTTYYHPVATSMPQTNITPLKKIKVYRRQKRSVLHQTQKNSTKQLNLDDQLALPDPNEMLNSLLLLAEGYVKLTDVI